jgi:hypothetical protein
VAFIQPHDGRSQSGGNSLAHSELHSSNTSLVKIHKHSSQWRTLHKNRDTCAEQFWYVKTAFFYPYVSRCLHPFFDPNIDISRYIDQHYRPVEQAGDYSVLQRTP